MMHAAFSCLHGSQKSFYLQSALRQLNEVSMDNIIIKQHFEQHWC